MVKTATLMEEDRPCPVCGKKMVQKFHERWNVVRMESGRERKYYWWCTCGHTEWADEVKPNR